MRQRVALARTLAVDPHVLLLDEPFSAVDAQTRMVLQHDLAQTLKAANKTALLITHDLAEAVTLSDRVLVMSRRPGTIIDEIAIDLPQRDNPIARRKRHNDKRCAHRPRPQGSHSQRRVVRSVPGGVAMGTGAPGHPVFYRAAIVQRRRRIRARLADLSFAAAYRRHGCRGLGGLYSRQPPWRVGRLSARHVADRRARALALYPCAADRAESRLRAAVHSLDGFYRLSENPRSDSHRVLPGHGQCADRGPQCRSRSDQSGAVVQGVASPDFLAHRVSKLDATDVRGLADRIDIGGGRSCRRRAGRWQSWAWLSAHVWGRAGQYADGVCLDRDADLGRRYRLCCRDPGRTPRAPLPAGAWGGWQSVINSESARCAN